MENLSTTEQKLYDYVKEKGEVSLKEIRLAIGEKYLGATGKLIRKDLVERGKRKTGEPNKYGYGVVLEKILKIKGVK